VVSKAAREANNNISMKISMIPPLAVLSFAGLYGGDVRAAPCEAQLKRPVPNCPAVTYNPDDCDSSTLSGKKGDKFYPNIINIMSSGHVYACAPHDLSCGSSDVFVAKRQKPLAVIGFNDLGFGVVANTCSMTIEV
jgi:hypothetical protein